MHRHPDPVTRILDRVDQAYTHLSNNGMDFTPDEIERELKPVVRVIARYFDLVPRSERVELGKFILLQFYKMARFAMYVEKKRLVLVIYVKSREVHKIVDGDVDTLSEIESFARMADASQTFRDILTGKASIERYEKTGA
jgi:hypothetical protein